MMGYAYHHWAERVEQTLSTAGAPVPLDDQSAYLLYPGLRWVFNKLVLSQEQALTAHPHGVEPADAGMHGPVFSKPIYNLWGLSTGARVIDAWRMADYEPGHFWLPVLPGPQLSTDAVVSEGRVLWTYTMRPVVDRRGSFVRWETEPLPSGVRQAVEDWAGRHLRDFRGVANFETRGRWIIEAPPRMAVQFLDFYGQRWLENVAAFYGGRPWEQPGPPSRNGRSLVLRLPAECADVRLRLRDRASLVDAERSTGCTVYLPWTDGQRLGDANDDGLSYRFALVNAPDGAEAQAMCARVVACLDGLPDSEAARAVRSALG